MVRLEALIIELNEQSSGAKVTQPNQVDAFKAETKVPYTKRSPFLIFNVKLK